MKRSVGDRVIAVDTEWMRDRGVTPNSEGIILRIVSNLKIVPHLFYRIVFNFSNGNKLKVVVCDDSDLLPAEPVTEREP